MKKFKVLDIVDTTMDKTEQRVAVIKLLEVIEEDSEEFDLSAFLQNHSFESSYESRGKRFVIDFNSQLVNNIIRFAHQQEIIQLNMSDFTSRNEYREGSLEEIYYHNNVKLL